MFDIRVDGQLTESLDEGIDHLFNFINDKDEGNYSYAMLFDLGDDVYNIVERPKMPCWGAIREYECGTRPDDHWPEDLQEPRHIFPEEGNPVAISFRFYGMKFIPANMHEAWNRFITEFAFHETESPWASILGSHEIVFKDDVANGVLFTNTKIDPTALVSLMRACGSGFDACSTGGFVGRWRKFVDEGHHPKVAFLASYKRFIRMDPNLFFSGTPMDRCDGVTFYERASYNRPRLEYVFGGDGSTGVYVGNCPIHDAQILYEDWLSSREDENARASVSGG